MADIKMIAPPTAWIRKYLIEDSLSFISWEDNIKGTMDNKLISNPTHRKIHWLDIMVIKEPITSEKKNKNTYGNVWNIKKGEESNFSVPKLEV